MAAPEPRLSIQSQLRRRARPAQLILIPPMWVSLPLEPISAAVAKKPKGL